MVGRRPDAAIVASRSARTGASVAVAGAVAVGLGEDGGVDEEVRESRLLICGSATILAMPKP